MATRDLCMHAMHVKNNAFHKSFCNCKTVLVARQRTYLDHIGRSMLKSGRGSTFSRTRSFSKLLEGLRTIPNYCAPKLPSFPWKCSHRMNSYNRNALVNMSISVKPTTSPIATSCLCPWACAVGINSSAVT